MGTAGIIQLVQRHAAEARKKGMDGVGCHEYGVRSHGCAVLAQQ